MNSVNLNDYIEGKPNINNRNLITEIVIDIAEIFIPKNK